MGIWEIVVGALVPLLSIIMIIVIILQEGHQAGLGAVTGGADSFLSRGKARTADAIFARVTRFCAIIFFVLVVLLNALAFFNLRGDIIGGDSDNNAVVTEKNDALVSEDETSADAQTEESEETPEPESEETPESESEETQETEPAPEPVSEVDSEAEPDAEVSSDTEPVPVDASETAEPVSEVTPKIDSAPKHVLEGTPQAEALRRHHSSRHHSSKKVRAMTSAEKWALTLGIILLCVISYLMGYYKLFGPSSNDDVKVEVAAAEEEETESPPIEKESVEDSSSLSKDTVSAVPIVEEEPVAPTEVVERSQEEAIRPTLVLGKKYKITGTRKKYVIKRGDYLAKIAEDEYGVKEFAKYIIAHNHFSNPNNIPVGKEILLPELEEMK